jgi:hypothetical protein
MTLIKIPVKGIIKNMDKKSCLLNCLHKNA